MTKQVSLKRGVTIQTGMVSRIRYKSSEPEKFEKK